MDGVSSSAVGKVVCVALFVDHFFQITYVIIFQTSDLHLKKLRIKDEPNSTNIHL